MELKIWARTMLTVQRHLGKVAKALDEVIMKRAMSSAFVTTKNLMEQSSENVSNFIINVSQSKVNLINLNTICVSALKAIDKTSAKILILKHIDNRPSGEIAKCLGFSDRTYFRRLNTAYENFQNYLKKRGFTSEYFVEKFSKEGWIMEVYYASSKFFEANSKTVENNLVDINFLSGVIKSITKAAHSSYS